MMVVRRHRGLMHRGGRLQAGELDPRGRQDERHDEQKTAEGPPDDRHEGRCHPNHVESVSGSGACLACERLGPLSSATPRHVRAGSCPGAAGIPVRRSPDLSYCPSMIFTTLRVCGSTTTILRSGETK
jgi:hypothetical protein